MDQLPFSIGNGGGSVRTPKEIRDMLATAATDVEIGSIMPTKREGNSGNTYVVFPDGTSLNSRGLPDEGSNWYAKTLPETLTPELVGEKRIHINIAGLTVKDYVKLFLFVRRLKLESLPIKSIILNFGCPNMEDLIFSYNPKLIERVLSSIARLEPLNWPQELKLWVKVSPIFDRGLLREVASVISRSGIVSGVQGINTVPFALAFDGNGRRVIDPMNGLAGLGGEAIRMIALGQTQLWREGLSSKIDFITIGGISTAKHLHDAQLAGASGVRLTTAYLQYGGNIFSDIIAEALD